MITFPNISPEIFSIELFGINLAVRWYAVSYILGFICDDRDLAKKRFEILNSEVQIAMIWPDLPTEIMQLPEILDFCLERTERTLFFFIHQGIEIAKFLAVIERSTLQEGF